MVLFSRSIHVPRSELYSHETPRIPPAEPEAEARDAAEDFAARLRQKVKVYIRGGMPENLAWSRAYRALTQPFDSKWGRRMMSARAHAAKRRKRAALAMAEKSPRR